MSPRTSSLCSHIFWSSGFIDCMFVYIWKIEFRLCARGRQWGGIIHFHWWTASIKPKLLFSHSGFVSWGLPFLQFNITYIVLQLVLSACVAAVKCRPVLYIVSYFLVFGDHWLYVCLHLKMEFRSCARGRHSLPLLNSFNKTEAAVFSFRLCFLRVPFLQFNLILNRNF